MDNKELRAFQQVLVRDSEDRQWSCSLYSYYNTIYNVHICANGWDFKYCIPYEGNEHLLGTTDSPQPKRWRADKFGAYWYVNNNAVCMELCDNRNKYDDERYNIGNYFRTKKEAKEMADKFKAMLKGG